MRVKSTLAILLAAAVLAGAGCNGGGQQAQPTPTATPTAMEVWVTEDDAGTEIALRVGDSLIVALDSNPTTGFEWALVSISDESVLSKVHDEYVQPSDVVVTSSQCECNGTSPYNQVKDEIAVEVNGSTLYIFHTNVVINCCLEYEPEVAVNGTDIVVKEIDNGPPCDCLGSFDLEIAVKGLEPGTYNITMNAWHHKDPVNFAAEIPALVGQGGEELWTFQPLKAGSATIEMMYARPWESVPPAQRFNISVTVQ
jgi:predicted secreted protein